MRAVIFDLDGTLADTSSLAVGMRTPRGLLERERSDPTAWRFDRSVCDLPGLLIARGYRVGIATRAPLPYASTLLHMNGLDACELRCNTDRIDSNKVSAIKELLGGWHIPPSEAIYVGNEKRDEDVARVAGVRFVSAQAAKDGSLLANLPNLATGLRAAEVSAVRSGFSEIEQRLVDSLASGVEDPEKHHRLLDQLRAQGTDGNPALPYEILTLRVHPGIEDRRSLQVSILDSLSIAMRACVMTNGPGIFGMAPEIVTKAERRSDVELHRAYLTSLKRLFPIQVSGDGFGEKVPVRVNYHVPYRSRFGKDVLRVAKDYGTHGPSQSRYRSGPNVRLGKLDAIADIMASGLVPGGPEALVPVPASAPTQERPAGFSNRLVSRVGQLAKRQVLDVLERGGREFMAEPLALVGERVYIVDDQITTGRAIRACIAGLRKEGYEVVGVLAYSVSDQLIEDADKGLVEDPAECSLRGLPEILGIPCPCEELAPQLRG